MLRQCLINAIWTGLMSTASPRAWIASSMTTTPTLLVENFIITLLMHKTWQKRHSIFRQGRDLDWWRRLPPRYFPQMTSAKLWYTYDYTSWPPTYPTSDFVYVTVSSPVDFETWQSCLRWTAPRKVLPRARTPSPSSSTAPTSPRRTTSSRGAIQ